MENFLLNQQKIINGFALLSLINSISNVLICIVTV